MSKNYVKILCIIPILLIAFATITTPNIVNAQSTTVYVDPPSIIDYGLVPGTYFNITVMVSDVTDLYTWEIKIQFDGSILAANRAIFPDDHIFAGSPFLPTGPIIDENSIHMGASLMGSVSGFTGSGKMVIIEFLVEGSGSTTLDFVADSTFLLDSNLLDIEFTAIGGYFENAAGPPPATIYVDPSEITDPSLVPCTNFDVNISIADATDVYGFSFKLGFDPSVLNVVDAVLGDFFPPSVTPTVTIDNVAGYVEFSAELSPPEPPVSGEGVLAAITFHVEDFGVSDLDLYDTELTDELGSSLPHEAYDGFFNNIQMAKLYIEPPEIIDPGLLPSTIFSVDVMLDDVENMYGYEFSLGYNTEMLTCIGIMVHPVLNETHFTVSMMLDDGAGLIWVNVTYYSPANPITTYTPVSIVTLTFMVDNIGSSVLDLYDTSIVDVDGQPIAHEATDGYVQTLIRDVAVIDVTCSHTWAYSGWIVNVTVIAKNLGNVTETFDVTAFYNSSVIGTQTVTDLAPNAEIELTFSWNTTDVAEGIYTLSAEASTVPFEYNLTNNVYVDGTIEIRRLIRDVAITHVEPDLTAVYPGWIVNITVIAKNEGNVSETFDVTVYYDNNTVGTQTVTDLAPNEEITLFFIWNTSGLEPCHNYTISAEASAVPYEYDLSDNFLSDGYVKIKIWGDINGDGKVNMKDMSIVAWSFGSYPGHPRWNPEADLDRNGQVNMRDIAIVARNFGQTC